MSIVAPRMNRIKPSPATMMNKHLRELRAAGRDIISLAIGQPDFDTPEYIREAAKKAIDDGATRYTAARGTIELREAICAASAKRRSGITYDPSEVVVSVGAKHTLFNLALALYDPGDEVLIPAPYWVSYPDMVLLAGGEPVIARMVRIGEACGSPSAARIPRMAKPPNPAHGSH